MAVAFFDLDRTVLDCNSGHLWLREEWRTGRYGLRRVAWASWFLARYALGHEGLDQAFVDAAAFYAGMSDAAMRVEVEAWFDAQVRRRVRPGALAALRAHRDAGDVTVLATSGTHYAADCAQRAWGLDDVVCTRLEVRDGRLTGGIEALAYGRAKLDLCEAWAREHGVPLTDCTFYTDSHTDLPLLEHVGRPVVVDPDRRLARLAVARGWPVVDWGRST